MNINAIKRNCKAAQMAVILDSRARLNARSTERNMMRLMEMNFTPLAWVVTGTYAYPMEDYGMCNLRELADLYEDRGLPWELGRMKMDVRNFLNTLKQRMPKRAELKWIVRYEEGKNPPAEGLPPRYHWHALIEGEGVTREMIDSCWPHGHTKCESFITTDDGPARMAKYLCKQKAEGLTGKCWWSHSRNLYAGRERAPDRREG